MGNVVGNVIRKRVIVRDGKRTVNDVLVDVEYANKTVRTMLNEIENLIVVPTGRKVDKFMFTVTDVDGKKTDIDFTEDILNAKIDPANTNPTIRQLLRESTPIVVQLKDVSSGQVVFTIVIFALLLIVVLALLARWFMARRNNKRGTGSKRK
jgi:hypothetical protein